MTGAGIVAVQDGCRRHGVSEADVARWWRRAEELDAEVAVCACCLGPCRVVWVSMVLTPGWPAQWNVNAYCDRCTEDG